MDFCPNFSLDEPNLLIGSLSLFKLLVIFEGLAMRIFLSACILQMSFSECVRDNNEKTNKIIQKGLFWITLECFLCNLVKTIAPAKWNYCLGVSIYKKAGHRMVERASEFIISKYGRRMKSSIALPRSHRKTRSLWMVVHNMHVQHIDGNEIQVLQGINLSLIRATIRKL